jgi:YVTN family beta-propeller protein
MRLQFAPALVLPVLFLSGSLADAQNDFVNWETPHVSPVAMTPDGSRLLAVNTTDNRLMIFGFQGNVPVLMDEARVGLDPVSVRARGNVEAWVVNHISDSVSVVDLSTGHVIATLDTDDEPCDVVFAGTPERAFVSCSQANTVLVFDPDDLAVAPVRIAIRGEDPRTLAVSPSGDEVYVAVFESGNQTTILAGGTQDFSLLPYPPLAVSDPAGPYGGQNPPPNSGAAFDPPINPVLPPAPAVGLIVRRGGAGTWLDDNGGDWTDMVDGANAGLSGRPVGWKLLDHDVAIIDAASLALGYADGLMNINMGLGVNPATGDVTVVGTDATNEIRYLPNLVGTFLRVNFAQFSPAAPGTPTVVDLNPHITYTTSLVPQTERDKCIGDPRGIVWNSTGTLAYVTGMGSNNLLVVAPGGARAGIADTIEVGEGPTGLVLDEARGQLYVMNKFEASISVVDTSTELETARIAFFDPSPEAIKKGRRWLYDTHDTSVTGVVSCA